MNCNCWFIPTSCSLVQSSFDSILQNFLFFFALSLASSVFMFLFVSISLSCVLPQPHCNCAGGTLSHRHVQSFNSIFFVCVIHSKVYCQFPIHRILARVRLSKGTSNTRHRHYGWLCLERIQIIENGMNGQIQTTLYLLHTKHSIWTSKINI